MRNITLVDRYPKEIVDLAEQRELADKIGKSHIAIVTETFNTPLIGSYNWDYHTGNERLERLYELGKELNWNVEADLDWRFSMPMDEFISDQAYNPMAGYPEYEALSRQKKVEFDWHQMAQKCSNFLHGEQGSMLVASQLVSCAPTYEAKLYASSQTFDEARHVEVFNKYLERKIGIRYPITPTLKAILDKILSDHRWYLKFIGMQLIIEGLAIAAFNSAKMSTMDPLFAEICRLVIRDETRHVTFGVNFLEDFIKTLPPQEREDLAEVAFEICVLMRERLIQTDLFTTFGFDVEAARKYQLDSEVIAAFRNSLFSRVMPNLKRVGLLTDNISAKFDALGLMQYSTYPDDRELDWIELEKPLFEQTACSLVRP